jgi:hypothetical protein
LTRTGHSEVCEFPPTNAEIHGLRLKSISDGSRYFNLGERFVHVDKTLVKDALVAMVPLVSTHRPYRAASQPSEKQPTAAASLTAGNESGG